MNTIEVNGIIITPDAQETLRRWQNSGGQAIKSDPERYVEYLNDTQDYLTRVMLDNGFDGVQDIADILVKLICIKDDLKLLISKDEES